MRWFVLVLGLAVLAVASPGEAARLTGVQVQARRGETVVSLRVADGGVRPVVHMLGDHRLVVDLPDVEPALASHRIPGGTPILERVRIGLHNDPAPRTRVVFDLAGPAAYSVEFGDRGLEVVLRASGSAGAVDDPPAPSRPAGTTGVPSATAEPIAEATPGATASPSPRPTPSPSPQPTSRPTASPSPRPTVPASPRPTVSPSPRPTPRPSASPSPKPTGSPSPKPTGSPEPTRRPSPPSPSPTPPPSPSPALETTTTPPRATESRGDTDEGRTEAEAPDAEAIPSGTVTLDFTSADVRSVIDLVANVGGYDVIFTPEVRGTVTIRVIDAPWEEALDAILEKKRLRATRHADLILVSPDDSR